MIFRVYPIAVYFMILQETDTATSLNNSDFCQRRIQELQSRVGFLVSQARLEISIVIAGIRNNLDGVGFNINYQLAQLFQEINKLDGNHVLSCVHQLMAELGKINGEDLNVCYTHTDIEVLNMQVDEILHLKEAAGQICHICYKRFCMADQLKERMTCVESDIVNVRNRVEICTNEVSIGALTAQSKSSRCAQEVEEYQSDVIAKAASCFDKCVQSSSQHQRQSSYRT